MGHGEGDVEVGHLVLFGLAVAFADGFGVRSVQADGEFGGVVRLETQHFGEECGVLAVEGHVGCGC